MCGNFSVPALFFLFLKQASILFAKLNEEFRDTLIEYDARIMPKDLLTISVSCSEPEAALPFNLVVPASQTGINSTNLVSQPTLQNYLVNQSGRDRFPCTRHLESRWNDHSGNL